MCGRCGGIVFLVALLGAGVSRAAELKVERVLFEGVKLRVVRVAPERVSLKWKGAQDQPMRTFGAVGRELVAGGRVPLLLMNAGIFEPGGVPSGLHVEEGQELRPVNLKGKGNFFLMPNGVLEWGKAGARVVESGAWAREDGGKRRDFALQSGPILVLGGRIHPAFNAGSPNVKHRNGWAWMATENWYWQSPTRAR